MAITKISAMEMIVHYRTVLSHFNIVDFSVHSPSQRILNDILKDIGDSEITAGASPHVKSLTELGVSEEMAERLVVDIVQITIDAIVPFYPNMNIYDIKPGSLYSDGQWDLILETGETVNDALRTPY